MGEAELKPCPFCDKPAVLGIEDSTHLVVCPWCWARVASHTEQGAVDRWNNRPADLAQARVDALWLAVLWCGTNRNRTVAHLADDAVHQLHGSERAVLTELWDHFEATNEDIVALLRRALSGRYET